MQIWDQNLCKNSWQNCWEKVCENCIFGIKRYKVSLTVSPPPFFLQFPVTTFRKSFVEKTLADPEYAYCGTLCVIDITNYWSQIRINCMFMMVGKFAYLGSKVFKKIISEAMQFMHILDENFQIKSFYPKKFQCCAALNCILWIKFNIRIDNLCIYWIILDKIKN